MATSAPIILRFPQHRIKMEKKTSNKLQLI